MLSSVHLIDRPQRGAILIKNPGRSRAARLSAGLSAVLVVTGASVAAGASVTAKKHHKEPKPTVICRPYDRRTIKRDGISYFVRNDVFSTERECLRLHRRGVGFTIIKSTANAHANDTDAFPEVVFGCAWGVCTPGTTLPRRVYRIKRLQSSWSTSWRQAPGHFDVAYDIWFGYLHTVHGHALGAELMIWLGTKRFGTPTGNPVLAIDHHRYYYARHRACDQFGCWNYILFRRVVPTTQVQHLNLLPFIKAAEQHRQVGPRWYLKSVDAGFEIWRQGRGLAIHNYEVHLKLKAVPRKKHKKKRTA